jgi:hypothetical protein
MSNLLKTLGDDWHHPHPYWKLIQSVVPSSNHIEEIEKCLTSIYVEGHYDYKLYKNTTKHTIYDLDISKAEMMKKEVEDSMKRESDSLEKLCKKMEELQKFLDGVESDKEEEEEEEEEEEITVKARGLQQEKGKQAQTQPLTGKETERAKKLDLQKKMHLAKSTKTLMANAQQKLFDLQKESEKHDLLIRLYSGYRDSDFYYQSAMKKIVLEYESSQDLEKLIHDIDMFLTEYKKMRKRVAPPIPCQGEGKNLCEAHLLPLGPTKWTEKGIPCAFACDIESA